MRDFRPRIAERYPQKTYEGQNQLLASHQTCATELCMHIPRKELLTESNLFNHSTAGNENRVRPYFKVSRY